MKRSTEEINQKALLRRKEMKNIKARLIYMKIKSIFFSLGECMVEYVCTYTQLISKVYIEWLKRTNVPDLTQFRMIERFKETLSAQLRISTDISINAWCQYHAKALPFLLLFYLFIFISIYYFISKVLS